MSCPSVGFNLRSCELAAQRSPDSYIAGGVAINRAGPRISDDIDIFRDSEARLESAAEADVAALRTAGYQVTSERERIGKREAIVARDGEAMPLEWVTDSAYRLFPTLPDELMGYVLHPVTRHSRFTKEEFQALATEEPLDVPGLHKRIRAMLEDAETFIAKLPSDALGVVFTEGEKAVQPDVAALDQYRRNPRALRGLWPSSPEITRTMLESNGIPKS